MWNKANLIYRNVSLYWITLPFMPGCLRPDLTCWTIASLHFCTSFMTACKGISCIVVFSLNCFLFLQKPVTKFGQSITKITLTNVWHAEPSLHICTYFMTTCNGMSCIALFCLLVFPIFYKNPVTRFGKCPCSAIWLICRTISLHEQKTLILQIGERIVRKDSVQYRMSL
jgi:hypothetical protein